MAGKRRRVEIRTTDFLLTITSDCTEDGILLAGYTVCTSIDVVLSAGRVALGLTGSVLFTARLLPGRSSCEIANRLDDRTLDGVELASGLTVKGSAAGDRGGVGESSLGLSRRVGRHCGVLLCGDERERCYSAHLPVSLYTVGVGAGDVMAMTHFFYLDPGVVAIVRKWRGTLTFMHHSNAGMERQLAALDLTHVLCEYSEP